MEKMLTASAEAAGPGRSHPASLESVSDAAPQFKCRGPPAPTIPSAHTSCRLPREPATGVAVIRNRHSLANNSEEDYFSQSASSGNNHVMPLGSAATVVRPENHAPAAAVGPRPGDNLSDTRGRYTPSNSLFPSPTQTEMRGATAYTQTTFVHLGCGLRVIARVNIGHKELECGPFRNTNHAHRANTPGYQTGRVLRVLEILRVMRNEIGFRYMQEERQILNVSGVDQRSRGRMTRASNFVYPGQMPRGDTGMPQSDYSQKRVGAPFIWCDTCRREYQVEVGAGGAPAAANVSALGGAEGGGQESAQAQAQAQAGAGNCVAVRVCASDPRRGRRRGHCRGCCHAPEEGTSAGSDVDGTEAEAAEDDAEGRRDGGRRATASPGRERTAEEQDNDFPRDGRQTHEEDSTSEGYGHNADVESDSSSPLDEDAKLTIQMNKLTFLFHSVQRQFKELIKHRDKETIAQLKLIFKTEFRDRIDLSKLKRTETVEEKFEAVAAPKVTPCTSVAENSMAQTSICQERKTDGGGVFCAPDQPEATEYDADEECENRHEEKGRV